MEKSKSVSFEKMMSRIGEIVDSLEDPNLPLEKSIDLYEEGMKLIKKTRSYLFEAEKRIKIITEEDKIEEADI
ncbi:exodeoxyribonuclease VII small subunit [candidate division WOR-3 bacterium]|nr:exodeoxyribonuclease VII small subunit [candidate division WOR-3 bacterium]